MKILKPIILLALSALPIADASAATQPATCVNSIHKLCPAVRVQPIKCPSVNAIQNTIEMGVIDKVDSNGSYSPFIMNKKFDTKELWKVGIFGIKSNSGSDAVDKAKTALSSLSFNQGPFYDYNNQWVCFYSNKSGYPVIATTEVYVEFMNTTMKESTLANFNNQRDADNTAFKKM